MRCWKRQWCADNRLAKNMEVIRWRVEGNRKRRCKRRVRRSYNKVKNVVFVVRWEMYMFGLN